MSSIIDVTNAVDDVMLRHAWKERGMHGLSEIVAMNSKKIPAEDRTMKLKVDVPGQLHPPENNNPCMNNQGIKGSSSDGHLPRSGELHSCKGKCSTAEEHYLLSDLISDSLPASLKRTAASVGAEVLKKNEAYGSSAEKTEKFLRLLYPKGILPSQYGSLGLVIRIFDKLMRIAHNAKAFGENPFKDIAGYGIIGAALDL